MEPNKLCWKILNGIKDKFRDALIRRHFLGADYAAYIYSLSTDKNNSRSMIKLESIGKSPGFNQKHGVPFPTKIGIKHQISSTKYIQYAYGQGSHLLSCETVYSDIIKTEKCSTESLTSDPIFWQLKPILYSGYIFEGIKLLIFLVLDKDIVAQEKEYLLIDINHVLKKVEDSFHQTQIFPEDYINVLLKNIGDGSFPEVRSSMIKLKPGYYYYNNSLIRLYYDFITDNLNIYKIFRTEHQEKFLTLAQEFEKSQKEFFRIKYYRDHFLHQHNVYIVGIALLSAFDQLPGIEIIKNFNCAYRPKSDDDYSNFHDIGTMWFITSMFHDVSYPIEKSSQWMDSFVQDYSFIKRYSKKPIVKTQVDISRFLAHIDYTKYVDELTEYLLILHCSNRKEKINYICLTLKKEISKTNQIRNIIKDKILNSRDHGVLSSMMLMDKFNSDYDLFKFLFPAVAAISIHNFMCIDYEIFEEPCINCEDLLCHECKKWKNSLNEYLVQYKLNDAPDEINNLCYIEYSHDPLAFLLILCDAIQDWGRYNIKGIGNYLDYFKNSIRLKNLTVVENSIIIDIDIVVFPLDSKENKSNLEKFIKHKKKEFARVFSRLKFIKNHDIIINLTEPNGTLTIFSMNAFN